MNKMKIGMARGEEWISKSAVLTKLNILYLYIYIGHIFYCTNMSTFVLSYADRCMVTFYVICIIDHKSELLFEIVWKFEDNQAVLDSMNVL
jgi:hypothetical protein